MKSSLKWAALCFVAALLWDAFIGLRLDSLAILHLDVIPIALGPVWRALPQIPFFLVCGAVLSLMVREFLWGVVALFLIALAVYYFAFRFGDEWFSNDLIGWSLGSAPFGGAALGTVLGAVIVVLYSKRFCAP